MKRCHFCTRILLVVLVLKWQVGPTEEGRLVLYTTDSARQTGKSHLSVGRVQLGSAWAVHHLENVCPHP